MWNSRPGRFALLGWCASVLATSIHAQQQAQGFALERLYPSAPGAGWIVLDTLDMHGRFGGAVEVTSDYQHNPLVIEAGSNDLAVVSSATSLDFGLAVTHDRYRAYVNFTMPLQWSGESGAVAGYTFTTPGISFRENPDAVEDVRLGVDARLLGDADSPFRLGAGAQLYIPNDNRANYDTDGTFRGMLRLLAAGDRGLFTYAGQAGVHLRPLNDAPIPQSPQGSELLFGIAGGVKLPVRRNQQIVVGSEVYGATALQSFLQSSATDKEWLISARYEGTGEQRRQGRVKLGIGRGVNPQFGAPTLRLVVVVELFGWARQDR